MPYNTEDARRQLLDDIASATDELGVALAALTEAYDHLDDRMADRMEEELFRPVQVAYGRARRTHTSFAGRHGLPRERSSRTLTAAPRRARASCSIRPSRRSARPTTCSRSSRTR